MPNLPELEKSLWREAYKDDSLYPSLDEGIETDVVVVGAGITGLTSAYLLKQAGFSVVVIDKRTVGSGTTGRTTGKVSSLHNLVYADLHKHLGEKVARIYGEANQAAVELVGSIIDKEKISCDWQRDDNYVYTAEPKRQIEFRQEADIAAKLGLPASFETVTNLPFEISAAVKFTNQGKMNSQKYLLGLAKAVNGSGSYVFENTKATGIRDGNPCRVKTPSGSIHSKHIIVATNVPTLPLLARGGYCALEYPNESYIIAGRPSKMPTGMYISPDDNHYSILPIRSGGKDFLLIGGESNISGVRLSTGKKYQKLASYAEKYFGVNQIDFKWSDRDYSSYDGVPLIGKAYPWSKNLYVGSAFRKWGLTNGTVAGLILSDLIRGVDNPWAPVFTPNRLKPILSIPRVAAHYLTGRA
jgi:glycine/D-amino acid oxidase-like deaminating enzyme